MRFFVRHVTRYFYSQPVFVEPMTVRLRPREDAGQRLNSFALDFYPEPAGTTFSRDWEGNIVALAWFNGLTQMLSVSSCFDVETALVNPFGFLLRPEATRLPLDVPDATRQQWVHYATPRGGSPSVEALARELLEETSHQTLPFCTRLTSWIHEAHRKLVRGVGDPWEPEETLARREGSCRDLAVLFIEVCRVAGLPARFVSGYAAGDEPRFERYMHAWCEVFLPGAGWRGFDPSIGMAVGLEHVAVAAALSPSDAAPTSGTFRSNTATSTMDAQIVIRTRSEFAAAPGEAAAPSDASSVDELSRTLGAR